MSYQIKGVVSVIGERQKISDKFQKKEIVIDFKQGAYDRHLSVEWANDRIDLLDGLTVGEEVEVDFDVESREYNGRYFTSARGWKIARLQPGKEQPAPAAADDFQVPDPDGLDLPF